MTVDPKARQFVDTVVRDNSVVMFALEWCDFCWSVRKLFKEMGIDYHSVDLDSVALQPEDMGGKIRKVLLSDIGVPTIPQIYIGETHIGGATELFEAYENGSLQKLLQATGASYDTHARPDLTKLMPQWLQPRQTA
ncbi:MAG: glutaredoxin domain-containing protein [Halioglobus sp.]